LPFELSLLGQHLDQAAAMYAASLPNIADVSTFFIDIIWQSFHLQYLHDLANHSLVTQYPVHLTVMVKGEYQLLWVQSRH